jgi:hypothetical protein
MFADFEPRTPKVAWLVTDTSDLEAKWKDTHGSIQMSENAVLQIAQVPWGMNDRVEVVAEMTVRES